MGKRVSALFVVVVAVGVAVAAPPAAAQAGPKFTETVLEMSPATLNRFAKALALEESARKSIAAKADAPPPKGTKTADEYASCQMQVLMTPEFQKVMQDATAAMSVPGKDPAATQKAAVDLQLKMQAMIEKACGPDPSKTYAKPDVGSLMRRAQTDAAKANGFTDRQYAILKERVTPLCLSDPTPPSPDGARVKGDGPVFYVYSATEVEALRPRCDALAKLIVAGKR